jgi:hypothetical protein
MTRSSAACGCLVGAVVLVTATGCARRVIAPALVPMPPLVNIPPFTRVLVAGFVSTPVAGIDGNEETVRLLRHDLRSEVSLDVLNMDPLRLEFPMLNEVPFWRRLGEEYREALIVTGVVDFKSAGRWYEERQAGRQTLRIGLPQYSLRVRLLLIDGRTGQRIATAVCDPTVAHAATGRERTLSVYYRLINQTMPSMLSVFGWRAAARSHEGPTCRREQDDHLGG